MKEAIGVGIIGTGFGAAVQLPGFLALQDVRVIGVASRNREKSSDVARMHGLLQTFASPEELIASNDVDLVSIATPQSTHAALVEAAVTAGKAILCEKPFTLSATEASHLLRLAESAGVAHAIDFEFRELPAWRLLKDRLDAGAIGTVTDGEMYWISGSWKDPNRPWGWQCDKAAGGGVISALGSHMLDAAEWLFGRVTMLTATTGIAVPERPDRTTGERKTVTAEDHAEIRMTTIDGAAISLALSNVAQNGAGLGIRIIGTDGILVLDSTSLEYGRGLRVREGIDDDHLKELPVTDPPEGVDARIPPFLSLARRFADAVRSRDRSFAPSFAEGLRARMLQDAVFASAEGGIRVDIPAEGK